MSKRKNPTPQVYDNVEMVDYSKTDGYVKSIVDKNHVIVSWYIRDVYDDKGNFARDENGAPNQERVEEKVKIKDLALTRRI